VPIFSVPVPPATPIVVAAAAGSIRREPLPVRLPPRVSVLLASKVRLLPDIVCAPVVVRAPVPDISVSGFVHVPAATVIVPESAALPIVRLPSVILERTVLLIARVPVPPLTPMVVVAVDG